MDISKHFDVSPNSLIESKFYFEYSYDQCFEIWELVDWVQYLFICSSLLLFYHKDVEKDQNWIGEHSPWYLHCTLWPMPKCWVSYPLGWNQITPQMNSHRGDKKPHMMGISPWDCTIQFVKYRIKCTHCLALLLLNLIELSHQHSTIFLYFPTSLE